MKLLDKAKADAGNSFFTRMKSIAEATDTINDTESLSAALHNAGVPNMAHVCARDCGSLTAWITLYVDHIESVITALQLLKELHYTLECITDEGRGVSHGYKIGDIIISLDHKRFPINELAEALALVFDRQEAVKEVEVQS